MRRSITAVLLAGGVLLAARPTGAQTPAPGPAGAATFVLSPEYAFGLTGGPRTYTARAQIPWSGPFVSWLSTGLVTDAMSGNDCSSCNGWITALGGLYDLTPAASTSRLRAYTVASLGALVAEHDLWLVPSVGLGARLQYAGDYAPRLEIRVERYGHSVRPMLALGVNLLVARRGVTALRR